MSSYEWCGLNHGGSEREYPDYFQKFGKNNVEIIKWDETCTDIDSHLVKLKKHLPNDEPFVLCGHSMGGGLIIELMKREKILGLQGVVLIGASKKIKQDSGLKFIMRFPWIFLWIFAILMVLALPITVFIWRSKTIDTYLELFRFLRRDGAKKIHRQYNLTLKKLGNVDSILQPEIPLLFVGLPEDTLVDKQDLKITKALFHKSRENLILGTNSIHLIEKYDPIIVEKIAEEAEFIGLVKIVTK